MRLRMEILENIAHRGAAPASAALARHSGPGAHLRQTSQRTARNPRTEFIGSGAFACILLTLVAFGGGLFLAFFGFNNSESGSQVKAIPRELLYLPPAQSVDSGQPSPIPAGALLDPVPDDGAFAHLGQSGSTNADPIHSLWTGSTAAALHTEAAFDSGAAFVSGGVAGLNSFGPATPSIGPTQAGFNALTLPAVPEPSSLVIMACGSTILLMSLRKRLRS